MRSSAVWSRAALREIVLAPGSRNAPLAFAAYDAAEAGLVRLHTRLDERSAGFLALGLTKVGSPAAVICTSGTAVANLHPALLEAAHAGVPLVAVTADRPERLRGTDANQTTDQVGIFGPLIPTLDLWTPGIVRDETVAVPGLKRHFRHGLPLHLNVRLDDPLVPEDRWEVDVVPPEREGREPGWWRGPPGETTDLGGRAAHGGRGRGRRRPAGARPGRVGGLAAPGRAQQRLAHGRARDPVLPPAPRRPAGRGDRARRGLRAPDALAPRLASPRSRGRRGVGRPRPRASASTGPITVVGTFDRVEASLDRHVGLVPALARGGCADRSRPRRVARRRARPDAVRRGGRRRRMPCRPRACSWSARRARSATST